jgi:hypothetical protein
VGRCQADNICGKTDTEVDRQKTAAESVDGYEHRTADREIVKKFDERTARTDPDGYKHKATRTPLRAMVILYEQSDCRYIYIYIVIL